MAIWQRLGVDGEWVEALRLATAAGANSKLKKWGKNERLSFFLRGGHVLTCIFCVWGTIHIEGCLSHGIRIDRYCEGEKSK